MLVGKGLLTPIQRRVLGILSGIPDQEHFYLTGGTALAEFHLGHRLSFDLDFFTDEADLVLPFSHRFEDVLGREGITVFTVRRFATMVEFNLSAERDMLRVDLALDAPFHLEPPTHSEYGVWVNSLPDLQAEKVLAYYGRTEPRDAVDLYFLAAQAGRDVLLDLAARKDPGFDRYWFAVALNRIASFPDEAERWPVTMLVPFSPPELKRTFLDWAMELMSQITGNSPGQSSTSRPLGRS